MFYAIIDTADELRAIFNSPFTDDEDETEILETIVAYYDSLLEDTRFDNSMFADWDVYDSWKDAGEAHMSSAEISQIYREVANDCDVLYIENDDDAYIDEEGDDCICIVENEDYESDVDNEYSCELDEAIEKALAENESGQVHAWELSSGRVLTYKEN